MRAVALILIALALGACSKRYCASESPYTDARESPRLKAPPGLTVPEPDPNLAIPKPASQVFAKRSPDDCLEVPPRLPAETATPKSR